MLFRIFNYPPNLSPSDGKPIWGVGEHTDYGVLTILKQDDSGGLQVKSKSGWVAAIVTRRLVHRQVLADYRLNPSQVGLLRLHSRFLCLQHRRYAR